jgi:hypothetical protein
MNRGDFSLSFSTSQLKALLILSCAGGAGILCGFLNSTTRGWSAVLLAGFFLLCVGVAGIFFVAVQYASGARWSIAFRRVPEAMTAVLPYGAILLAAVFVAGSQLYPWRHADEHLRGFKAAWLNWPFFLIRATVFLGLWWLFSRTIVRCSRRQDQTRSQNETRLAVRASVVFLLVFAVTFWLASFDWIMSLEPHWYSTIFGIYQFAGMFSSGLAVLILVAARLQQGPLRDFVNEEHFHDLGKLLFAFSTFWMYIWFSQYMLIWYSNIPEETEYFLGRQHHFWQPLFLLNVGLNWVAPFFLLLSRRTKRDPRMLAKVARIVIAGRWVDLYLAIQPATGATDPLFSLPEAGAIVGATAFALWVTANAFHRELAVPLGDPGIVESLHYHN